MASDSARREDHFKKKLSKTDLPFKFCKIGLKNTLFIFGRKNGRLLLLLLLLLFVATLSDFGLLFFLIEALIEMLLRKKLFDVRFGNCSTPKVPHGEFFRAYSNSRITVELLGNYCRITVELLLNYCTI